MFAHEVREAKPTVDTKGIRTPTHIQAKLKAAQVQYLHIMRKITSFLAYLLFVLKTAKKKEILPSENIDKNKYILNIVIFS